MFRSRKNQTDEKLMQQLQRGRQAAFDTLYARYHRRVYTYFWRMLKQDEEVAADFTQQLFLQLVEKRSYFDTERNFANWLFRLAANLCKNEYRRRERQNRAEQLQPLRPTSSELQEGNLDQSYWRKMLDTAIGQLSFAQRQCFLLRHQENYSLEEIADILDCPVGTVKSRLYYANKRLAELLEKVKNV